MEVDANVPLSGGLMRYHSAPCSMLESLLDEEFYPCGSRQGEEFEFSRFLRNSAGGSSLLLGSSTSQQADNELTGSILNEVKEHRQSDRSRMTARQSPYAAREASALTEDVKAVSLRAIFEHGLEDSLLDNCCRDQLPVAGSRQMEQLSHQSTTESSCYSSLMTSASEFSGKPQEKSNLIRHSSSPAGFLSRLVMDEITETHISQISGSYMAPSVHHMPKVNSGNESLVQATVGTTGTGAHFSEATCLSGVGSIGKSTDAAVVGTCTEPNRSGLMRQSSSPAGLLSQLSLDWISTICEKASMPSLSGTSCEEATFDGRGAAASVGSFEVETWDEVQMGTVMQNAAAFGQRKRGRGILGSTLPIDALQLRCAPDLTRQPDNSVPSTSTTLATAVHMESSMVLCKARAKRGCATHPRSIAERVRRTKISERMRKLQELVPNMDKQTNTADMLDEAVEYVRFLQRQIQELSETRSMCNGMCKHERHAPL